MLIFAVINFSCCEVCATDRCFHACGLAKEFCIGMFASEHQSTYDVGARFHERGRSSERHNGSEHCSEMVRKLNVRSGGEHTF